MTNLSSKKNNLSGKSEKIINSLESLLSDYNFGLRLLDVKQKQKLKRDSYLSLLDITLQNKLKKIIMANLSIPYFLE